MIRNYLVIAWRNLWAHKVFSLVSIIGLSLGTASLVVLLYYVQSERSYDDFHENADQIYRIRNDHYRTGELTSQRATTYRNTGPSLAQDFPEVRSYARLTGTFGNSIVISPQGESTNGQPFYEESFFYADSSFLTMFTFPLLKGDASTALAGTNGVVVSERAAQRYFGDDDPIGQTVVIDGDKRYQVTGVLQDVPKNSHLQFDWLFAIHSLDDFKGQGAQYWGGGGGDVAYTYIQLHPEADPRALERKLPRFVEKYRGQPESDGAIHDKLLLQPLRDIHLHSSLELEAGKNGSEVVVDFLEIIGVLVMLIAWLNYVIISMANALGRVSEIGVRKAMGAQKDQIVSQFLIETCLLNALSCVIAVLLLGLFIPIVNSFTHIAISFALFESFFTWVLLLAVFLAGVLVVGAYPAVFLSTFPATAMTKGRVSATSNNSWLRKGLVVFQFAAAVVLISFTMGIVQQLRYMRTQDLGINIEKTLVVRAPGVTDSTYFTRLHAFKTELQKIPAIKSITASSEIPGKPFSATRIIARQNTEIADAKKYRSAWVDEAYLSTFEARLIAGRNFDVAFGTDEQAIVINEALANSLNFRSTQEAIGQKVLAQGAGDCTIVGVVGNYHQQSLKEGHEPIVFFLNTWRSKRYFSIKLDNNLPRTTKASMAYIQSTWKELFPANPFDYFFLDDFYTKQYQSDRQFGQVFGLFSGLAIFIACLGLVGLALFTTERRTKEIGIRKVLGASTGKILFLLNQDFLILILLATVVAWPAAYLGINEWLQSYAFRIDITIWLFIVPSILILILAVMAVSSQTWRFANKNPVDSLRSE